MTRSDRSNDTADSPGTPRRSRRRLLIPLAAVAGVLLAPLPLAAGVVVGSSEPEAELESVLLADEPLGGGEQLAVAVTPEAAASEAGKPTPTSDPEPADPVPPQVIERSESGRPEVAITLDADLSEWTRDKVRAGTLPPQVNWEVLDYLESSGTKSTVFVTGLWAQEYPDAMTRMAGNPLYELANHSWDHDAWTYDCYGLPVMNGDPVEEVTATSSLIAEYTGAWPRYFRFPGLCHDADDVALVASTGAATVDYDLDGSDAFAENPQSVANALAAQASAGSIVVLHLNGVPNAPVTAQILQALVPALEAKGLTPVTMSELMAE
ncbi:MAG: polysaccharide deacetylase family protein [Actinobacteria bacterium]|nr:polysaccharide deacetylase family protein [Actinomycetota bacterium]